MSKSLSKTPSLKAYLKQVPHFSWKMPKHASEVLVIGTAHVSKKSVEDVQTIFGLYKPDTVAVELCKPRFETLMKPKHWRHLDIAQVIKQRKVWLLCSSLILSAFQRKIGEESGSKPGMEMKTALILAQNKDIPFILADREVRITLSRAWAKLGFFSRLWLSSFLLGSLFVSDDVNPDEIEKLKSEDILADLLAALPKRYASLTEVILHERDLYIAENVRQSMQETQDSKKSKKTKPAQATAKSTNSKQKKKVLVVLGAAHLKGVEHHLKNKTPVDMNALTAVPRRNLFKNVFSWIIFALVFFAISAIFFQGDVNTYVLQNLALSWVMSRGIGAGIGALIAWPRLPTLLTTVLSAPFSYFFGFAGIRLWMVSALTELRFHKPQVEDFENITKDTETFTAFTRSLYRNRVIHLLFLITSVSLGLTLGNLFFFYVILSGLIDTF